MPCEGVSTVSPFLGCFRTERYFFLSLPSAWPYFFIMVPMLFCSVGFFSLFFFRMTFLHS